MGDWSVISPLLLFSCISSSGLPPRSGRDTCKPSRSYSEESRELTLTYGCIRGIAEDVKAIPVIMTGHGDLFFFFVGFFGFCCVVVSFVFFLFSICQSRGVWGSVDGADTFACEWAWRRGYLRWRGWHRCLGLSETVHRGSRYTRLPTQLEKSTSSVRERSCPCADSAYASVRGWQSRRAPCQARQSP